MSARFVSGIGRAARWWARVGLILLIWAGSAAADVPAPIEGELLVGLREGADPRGVVAEAQAAGGEVIREIPAIGVLQLRVPPRAAQMVMQALARKPDVDFVEPNRALPPAREPNDPDYPAQWHLPRIGAPEAWNLSTGEGVVIAILDSGVDASHPDLGPKLVGGYDATGGHTTDDLAGHGTAVAGSATAVGNNALGIASPAWSSWLMPIRVAGSDGWATDADIADGLVWAADNGARVLNLSFATVADSSTIVSAARYATQSGGLVVAAAGNCGCRVSTRDTPYILNVGGTDTADGPSSTSTTGDFVDLSAPSVGIYTTVRGGLYRYTSGTSHASPIVAGVAALLFSVDPSLTPAEVEGILEDTALDLGGLGWDPQFGHGRIDAAAAVTVAAGGSQAPIPDPSDTNPPEVAIDSPADGALVAGMIEVSVSASDDVAVDETAIFLDGQPQGSLLEPPYVFWVETGALADGSHALEAVAWDSSGNEGRSAVTQIEVRNTSTADTEPPTAAILSPADGSRIRSVLRVDAIASDDSMVDLMELLVDGEVLDAQRCADSACSVRFSWKARSLAKGKHRVEVRATDAARNQAMSPAVEIVH